MRRLFVMVPSIESIVGHPDKGTDVRGPGIVDHGVYAATGVVLGIDQGLHSSRIAIQGPKRWLAAGAQLLERSEHQIGDLQ